MAQRAWRKRAGSFVQRRPASACARSRSGIASYMIIAGVAVFCVLLLVAAFLAPRLSRHPQRAGQKTVGVGQRGAGLAPGKLGHWLSKPFHSAQKAISRSGSAGRRGRGQMPL